MIRAVRMSCHVFCRHRNHRFQHGYAEIEVTVVIVMLACTTWTSPISFICITLYIVNFIVNVFIVTVDIEVIILDNNFVFSWSFVVFIVVDRYRRDDLRRQCHYHHPSYSTSSSGLLCCRRSKRHFQLHLVFDFSILVNIVNVFIYFVDIINGSHLEDIFVETFCYFCFAQGVNHCHCAMLRRHREQRWAVCRHLQLFPHSQGDATCSSPSPAIGLDRHYPLKACQRVLFHRRASPKIQPSGATLQLFVGIFKLVMRYVSTG